MRVGARPSETTPSMIEARARALEGRLHAPCCRDLMLEGHSSELTQQLRQEIRTRFRSGQSELDIEAELRHRYGDTIVAVPFDRDPRPALSWALAFALIGSAGLLVGLARAWKRRSGLGGEPTRASSPEDVRRRDEWDARLERELRELER